MTKREGMHVGRGALTCAISPAFVEMGAMVNFKDCGVRFFFINDRNMLKEEYDRQLSTQGVIP